MNYKELEKYIRQLFQQYLNKYRLSVEDKDDVIQDSLLQIWRKEQDGTLEGDIEDNKNYIFITTRNFTLQRIDKVIKRNNHDQINEDLDVPNKELNILDLTDIKYKKDLILQLMTSKSFTDRERRIVDYIFQGYSIGEIKKIENTGENRVKNDYANLKVKLKIKANKLDDPKHKFEVIFNDGRIVRFCKQKDICQAINMLPTTFSYWKKKGRTTFKDFKIEYLR